MGAGRATVNNATVIRSGSVAAWAVAIRPRSLLVAISPVLVGATLGFAAHRRDRPGGRRCWCWARRC